MQKKTETLQPTTETKPATENQPAKIAVDDLEWVSGGIDQGAAALQSGHDAQRPS